MDEAPSAIHGCGASTLQADTMSPLINRVNDITSWVVVLLLLSVLPVLVALELLAASAATLVPMMDSMSSKC